MGNVIYNFFLLGSGCFIVSFCGIYMHISKHEDGNSNPSKSYHCLITILVNLKDGRLLLGKWNNNSYNVCLFCLTRQTRPSLTLLCHLKCPHQYLGGVNWIILLDGFRISINEFDLIKNCTAVFFFSPLSYFTNITDRRLETSKQLAFLSGT